jgi:lantibiotic leader peptide-processing serine protease
MNKTQLASAVVALLAFVSPLTLPAQQLQTASSPAATSDIVPNRLIVLYRDNAIPSDATARITALGGRVERHLPNMGLTIVTTDAAHAPQIKAALSSRSDVAYVIHDRIMHANEMLNVRPVADTEDSTPATAPAADSYYTSSAQNWAVKQVGGFGKNIPGAPATGPWSTTTGAGVTIAVLDSGISSTHPDTALNITYNASLVDQTALPSPCDDASPEDQSGHGTWTASLAAGAMGSGTGLIIGVAPAASLLNIKVLERVPASGNGNQITLCNNGTAAGLMSWVIEGIQTASDQHADIISMSVGGLIDSYSGEGEGVIESFNRATYLATQAGSLLIAAAGNNGEDLDGNEFVEMPAQSRNVLAVVASTNPNCAQNLSPDAKCAPGAITLAYYSNYGTSLNAVAAPGGAPPQGATGGNGATGYIRGACSTGLPNTQNGLPSVKGHSFGCFNLGHAQYVQATGTSASAPLVAGVAALVKAAYPSITPAELTTLLQNSATPEGSPNSSPLGYGIVNAAAALALQAGQ